VSYRLLASLLLLIPFFAKSQAPDSNALKRIYDRCLDFDEAKADSIAYYSKFIAEKSRLAHFDRGIILSTRLSGLAQEFNGNYDSAIVYYLQTLDLARKWHAINYEISALGDLAYIYVNTKQPGLAKERYKEAYQLAAIEGNVVEQITTHLNLGAIYNQLNLGDSALYFLNEGLVIAKTYHRLSDEASFYNNIGNVYFARKEYTKALAFFMQNRDYHNQFNKDSELWRDNLNIADAYISMKKYDSGYVYAIQSLDIANRLASKSRQSDCYAMLSRLYLARADYKNAFEYQQKWYAIDTSLVNEKTNTAIAGLQEKFHAKETAQENKVLQTTIEQSNYRNRLMAIGAVGAALAALLITVFFVQKRLANKRLQLQNDLIKLQNQKLATLNYEKNSLISIVSHDLASPFSSIKMWSQVLQNGTNDFNADQKMAVERIGQSANRGELLIQRILDIEKAETNRQAIQLESFELNECLLSVIGDFKPTADSKQIKIHFTNTSADCRVVSDKQLIGRIMENLLSNAIKFTASGKNIWVSTEQSDEQVCIIVSDEGVGIEKDELPYLFQKYSSISSRSTNGETSNGLGLAIVLRLVNELNGSIHCESEPGKGSVFTVYIKK
jgi:signal transduction histidine kinase